MNLQEVRQRYPQYNDMSDQDLAIGLHQKFYSDLSFADFSARVGFQPVVSKTPEPSFIEEVGRTAKGYAEAAGSTMGSMLGTVGGGAAGIAELIRTGGDLESAAGAVQEVGKAFQLEPETPEGKKIAGAVEYPFRKLAEFAGAAGDWTLNKTNSPELATAVHTGIETLPVWLFPALRKSGKLVEKVKGSNVYRKATIKERGVILQNLEETLRKNPGLTEGEILRKYPYLREEALARRTAGERPAEPIERPVQPAGPPPETAGALPPGQGFELVEPKPKTIIRRPKFREPSEPKVIDKRTYQKSELANRRVKALTKEGGLFAGRTDLEVVPIVRNGQNLYQVQSVTPEERTEMNRVPEELRLVVDQMKEQVRGGEAGGVSMPVVDEEGPVTRFKSTYPEWFGTKKGAGFNRDEFLTVLDRAERGQQLTPRQEDTFNKILDIAETQKGVEELTPGQEREALEDLFDDAHEAGRRGAELPDAQAVLGRELTAEEQQELSDSYESGKVVQAAIDRKEIMEEIEDAEGIRAGERQPGGEVPAEGRRPEEVTEERKAPGGDQLLVQAPQEREQGRVTLPERRKVTQPPPEGKERRTGVASGEIEDRYVAKPEQPNQLGGVELHNVFDVPRLLVEELKKLKVDIPNKDMAIIGQHTSVPTWVADEYPEFQKIQDVIDRRFFNRNMIRNGYQKELLDAWDGLTKKEVARVGELLWKGDRIRQVLNKNGLAKLSARERKAYQATRAVLDFIWHEDLPQLMCEMGHSESEIAQHREQVGRVVGYMPHPRHGRYFARAKKDKQVLARKHFDDVLATITRGKAGWRAPRVKRAMEKEFPDALIELGTNEKPIAEDAYFAVSPEVTQELIDAAIKRLGPEMEGTEQFKEALVKTVADIFKVRGFMAHGVERQNIPGFEIDNWQDAVLEYVAGFSGFKSKMIAAREMWDAWPSVDWAGKPRLRRFADKQVRDTFTNADAADLAIDRLRSLLFYKFLAANVKSAALQVTQNYITAIPRLIAEEGFVAALRVQAEMNRAAADIAKMPFTKKLPGMSRRRSVQAARLSETELRALTRARDDGTVATQLTEELAGKIPGKYGSPGRAAAKVAQFMFQSMELFNRETTFLTAYRIAEKKGMPFEEAYQFARKIIDQTHWRYGNLNLPGFARGGVGKYGRGFYAFRHYTRNLFHFWRALATRHGMRGKYALVTSFAALLLFGGIYSIPFIKTLNAIYLKATGRSLFDDIKKKAGKYSNYVLYGAPEMVGVDLTGSLGTDIPESLPDLIGAPTTLLTETGRTIQDIQTGDYQRAVEDSPLMPTSIRNALQSVRLSTRGLETRSGKKKVDEDLKLIKLTLGERIAKSIGFQPSRVSETYRTEFERSRVRNEWLGRRERIVQRFTKMVNKYGLKKDSAGKLPREIERTMKAIETFNKNVPALVAPIKPETLAAAMTPDIPPKREMIYNRQQAK